MQWKNEDYSFEMAREQKSEMIGKQTSIIIIIITGKIFRNEIASANT